MTQLRTAIIDTGAGFKYKKVSADYNLDHDPDYLDALRRRVRVQRPHFKNDTSRGFASAREAQELLVDADIKSIKPRPYRGYNLNKDSEGITLTVYGDGAGVGAWSAMLIMAFIVVSIGFLVSTSSGLFFLILFGITAIYYLSKSNRQTLTIGNGYFSNGVVHHNIEDVRTISITHKGSEVATASPTTNNTGIVFAFTGVGGVAFGTAVGVTNAMNQTGQVLGKAAQASISKRSYSITYRYGASTVTAFTNLTLPKAESILEKIVELANQQE